MENQDAAAIPAPRVAKLFHNRGLVRGYFFRTATRVTDSGKRREPSGRNSPFPDLLPHTG